MEVNRWLELLRRTRGELKSADEIVQRIADWVFRNDVGKNASPRQIPPELEKLFDELSEVLRSSQRDVSEVGDSLENALTMFMSGNLISEEQYHLLMAQSVFNFTNKNVGLSEYDDYDVFKLFYYVDGNKQGYVIPDETPNPPSVRNKDGSETIKARLRFGGMQAPEEVSWKILSPEQQAFFKDHLPDVAKRFKR